MLPMLSIEKHLLKHGIRPTRQRVLLAKLLIGDGKHRHFTADSLLEASRKQDLSVSQATVYNSLRIFSESGLIREVAVEGIKSYYDTLTEPHPHYFYEDLGVLEDAPRDAISVEMLGPLPPQYEVSEIDVVIRLKKKRDTH